MQTRANTRRDQLREKSQQPYNISNEIRPQAIDNMARGSLYNYAKHLGLIVPLLFLTSLLSAQSIWRPGEPSADVDQRIFAKQANYMQADTEALRDLLWSAPHERETSPDQSATIIELPQPDGSSARFKIVAYDISE
ncbi:MAG: hypothetical protein AAGF87_08725, partial [Bacteroidota bacterium]